MVNNVFFFFQAEDGIRDYDVTGVQTCALPICGLFHDWLRNPDAFSLRERGGVLIDALMAMLHR